MLSVDRRIVVRSKWAWRGTVCTEQRQINFIAQYSFSSIHTHFRDSVTDLQAVVAVANQEVLLEPQLPLPTCTVDQRHPRRDFLICLVCMVQKGCRAVEGQCHLLVTENSTTTRQRKPPLDQNLSVSTLYIIQNMTASPRLTCMLCCGCSTRYWLSPVGGLLELLVRARGCGLSTKNGGWVPSLKCRGISMLFLSWRVCVMSKSRTTSCGAKQPDQRDRSEILYLHLMCALRCIRALLISVVDFSDRPPSLVLLSVNHRLRHETPAPPRHPPSALTACSNREPRRRYAT